MKLIVLYWNLVHYYLYKWECFLTSIVDAYNPLRLLYESKAVKKIFEKHGAKHDYFRLTKMSNDPKNGMSSIRAGFIMSGVLGFYIIGTMLFIQGLFGFDFLTLVLNDKLYKYMLLGSSFVIVLLINEYLFFGNDKYLLYFKKFEKHNLKQKFLFSLVTIITIFGAPIFFFLGLLSINN